MRTALLIIALLAPAAVQAAEAPYDDTALRQALPAAAHSVGVTVVGQAGPGAAAARDAVVTALQSAGRQVRQVGVTGAMPDPPATGVVRGLCSLYQLDLIAVVWRGPNRLDVELFDRTGAVVGHPVMPTGAAPPSPADARALGEELYTSEQVTLSPDGSASQGRAHRPLRGADFYSTIGRPDLAEEYRSREQNKSAVRGIGGVTIGVGVLWGFADLLYSAFATGASAVPCLFSGGSSEDAGTEGDWCHPHQPSPLPWLVAGLGLGLVVIPSAIPSDPIPEAERRQLVDHHNAELRARAGLTVRLAPVVTPEGGGMMLSGRF